MSEAFRRARAFWGGDAHQQIPRSHSGVPIALRGGRARRAYHHLPGAAIHVRIEGGRHAKESGECQVAGHLFSVQNPT